MKNMVFSKVWAMAVLVILIAGGFFAWQYLGTTTEEKEAQWDEYANEKYNFRITYPSHWNKYDYDEGNTTLAGITFSPLTERQLIENGGPMFTILPLHLSDKTNQELAQLRVEGLKSFDANLETEMSEVSLSGTSAVRAEMKRTTITGSSLQDTEGPEGKAVVYWLLKNTRRFEISFVYPVSEKEKYGPIFDQMIATFQFLE